MLKLTMLKFINLTMGAVSREYDAFLLVLIKVCDCVTQIFQMRQSSSATHLNKCARQALIFHCSFSIVTYSDSVKISLILAIRGWRVSFLHADEMEYNGVFSFQWS